MKRGLVSVTFRQLSCGDVAGLCVENGLEYIEWGGDIHVPSGDLKKAREVSELCRAKGLHVCGYGSYYNAADDISAFYPVLETAKELQPDYVRIWAGRSRFYDGYAAENIKKAVSLAKEAGIRVSLECHRGTMTEDPELAPALARSTGCRLHFQPNPDVGFEDNLAALTLASPYLCAVHVFAWDKGDIRLPLSSHEDQWRKYIKAAPSVPFLLEFVAGNDPENLRADAQTLKKAGE